MIIRRGFPHQLYFDEDFMRIIGTEDNSDPEKNYRLWEECVHPDDMPLIKEAIESTQHNIRAEVKYRWRHKTRGLYTAYSTGMLAGKEDGCVTIYGFFKGVPADRTQLYGYDPDLQLLTRLLAEKMLDSFASVSYTQAPRQAANAATTSGLRDSSSAFIRTTGIV